MRKEKGLSGSQIPGTIVETIMLTVRRQTYSMSRRISVGNIDELQPGQRKLVFIDGRSIVLFNIEGVIHGIDDSCPHQGASLGKRAARRLRAALSRAWPAFRPEDRMHAWCERIECRNLPRAGDRWKARARD